jgi:hypothetical protein
MNPYSNPEADNFFQQISTAIQSGANTPEKLLKIFPQLCEHSLAMARLLTQKTVH